MKENKRRSDCPISYALDFFGDKWTFLIIRDMVFKKKQFYKEFLEAEEGIATNILSDRLKRLETIQVIVSSVYKERKTQKVYRLTDKGKALIPALVELMLWSIKFDSNTAAPPEFELEATANKADYIEKILSQLNEN